MSTVLPPEMISDVLCRLPVKSLLRFRSTSKPLCSLIDGPDFSKRHLNQTHSHQRLVLASGKLYSIDLSSLERAVEMEHPLKSVQGDTEVIGSCNGLLCLSNSDAEIVVLWNMSTRKHHRLPNFPIASTNLYPPSYGFGYDSVHDDYKVVRIVGFGRLNTQVSVYSLKSNSWKRVADFPYEFPYQSKGVFADGAVHWLIYLRECDDYAPAAFDLATEEYRAVPQQPASPDGNFMRAWESCLCGICYYAGKQVEIWLLNHNESWDKWLSISDPRVIASSRCIVPMAYLSNGNEVLLLRDYKNFLRYDIKTNKVKNVKIHGMPDSFDVALYVESLVNPSPNRVNGGDATMGKSKSERSKKNASKRDNFLSKGFKLVL